MRKRDQYETVSREELARVWEEFARLPFPRGIQDDEVKQLRGELVESDSFYAGLVSTLLGGGQVPPTRLAIMARDEELEDRLKAITTKGSPVAAADANRCLEYWYALKRLVELASAYASQHSFRGHT
jgi:hypothetical protein